MGRFERALHYIHRTSDTPEEIALQEVIAETKTALLQEMPILEAQHTTVSHDMLQSCIQERVSGTYNVDDVIRQLIAQHFFAFLGTGYVLDPRYGGQTSITPVH